MNRVLLVSAEPNHCYRVDDVSSSGSSFFCRFRGPVDLLDAPGGSSPLQDARLLRWVACAAVGTAGILDPESTEEEDGGPLDLLLDVWNQGAGVRVETDTGWRANWYEANPEEAVLRWRSPGWLQSQEEECLLSRVLVEDGPTKPSTRLRF